MRNPRVYAVYMTTRPWGFPRARACIQTTQNTRSHAISITYSIASIPAPLLKRGPGNHCLRVGGFNSKFVVKLFVFYQLTFCTMVTHAVD